MNSEKFEFKRSREFLTQYKLMEIISNGMFFCKMHPILSRNDDSNYKAHLLEMNQITNKISPKEYYKEKQKYNKHFLSMFSEIKEIMTN